MSDDERPAKKRLSGRAKIRIVQDLEDYTRALEQAGKNRLNRPIRIACEWSVIAAYARDIMRDNQALGGVRDMHVRPPARCTILTGLGEMVITGDGDATKIEIHVWAGEMGDTLAWGHVVDRIERFADELRDTRKRGQPTHDDAIEFYYRSRAQGTRVTLRQIAEQYGFSYEALRKHKQRYTGWGSGGQDVSD